MKKLRIVFIVVAGLFFYSILLSSFVRNIYLAQDKGEKWGSLAKPVKFMAELPSAIKQSVNKPEFYVKNKNSEDGISFSNKTGVQGYPKLLVTYKTEKFGQKFELLDLSNGKSIKKWEPDNESLYARAYNELNPRKSPKGSDLYFMHPLLLKDSSLIFSSQLTSLLTRIDKDGTPLWLNNDRRYHHTTEFDHEGNIYSCTMPFVSGKYDILPEDYEGYKNTLIDDEITKINPETGEVLFSKSIIQILIDNGYENLLLSKGQFISDIIHLNDIQPALTTTEYWQKGDLLVSCRNISAVFLYRPSTNKIIWLRNGPWYNQHDADFYENSKIVVFGNDIIREESTTNPKVTTQNLYFNSKTKNNEIYVYDFEKDSVSTPYHRLMQKEKVRTRTSGRCDILENGDIFVEDTNNGRVVIGDSINKKLEFVKRIDQEHISSLFWSRIIY